MDGQPVTNFGGNLRFTPRHYYAPKSEAEVLHLLARHAHGKIRVAGARHSWSPAIVTDDVLLDLRHFDRVTVERGSDGEIWATIGGGCRLKHLLCKLHAQCDATLPSLGLITEQTIAGAISTGTHGSGKHSLSHYIDGVRVAAYDAGKPRIYEWSDGPELRAARCGLGCMGVILAVRIRCVPKYDVVETIVPCATLDEVLLHESEFPLQQFFFIPHRWTWFAQHRRAVPVASSQSLSAKLYRAYWFFGLDIGFHLLMKFFAAYLRSPRLVRLYFRTLLPLLVMQNRTVTDASERMLIMEHELFRHMEIELFILASHLHAAAEFVRHVLTAFDDRTAPVPASLADQLKCINLLDALLAHRGTFTHHYPIAFRRVLADDTLLSMSSGPGEPYYSLSFITFVEPRERFYRMADFLARSMTVLFGARLHWGKYFPLSAAEIAGVYPHLEEFRQLCGQIDPHGVFRNGYTERVLGFDRGVEKSTMRDDF
jgi:FAD/FMN-containing dehydrogenase